MTTETREQAIARLCDEYREHSAKLPEDMPRLSVEQFATALDQSIAKTGRVRFLKNAPTFRDRPFGSIFLRLYRWHGGSGNLDGYMFAKWDCEYATRQGNVPDWPTFDEWDTTALVARGGVSSAVEAWRRALGVER